MHRLVQAVLRGSLSEAERERTLATYEIYWLL